MDYRVLLVFLIVYLLPCHGMAQEEGYWTVLQTTTYDQSNLSTASVSVYALIYKDPKDTVDNTYGNQIADRFRRYIFANVLTPKERGSPYIQYFRGDASERTWSKPDDIELVEMPYGRDRSHFSLEEIAEHFIAFRADQLEEAVIYQDRDGTRGYAQIRIRTFKLREDGASFEETSTNGKDVSGADSRATSTSSDCVAAHAIPHPEPPHITGDPGLDGAARGAYAGQIIARNKRIEEACGDF